MLTVEDIKKEAAKYAQDKYLPLQTFDAFVDGVEWILDSLSSDIDTALRKKYDEGRRETIEKACEAYCKCCDTQECIDDECNWVKKFRNKLKRL